MNTIAEFCLAVALTVICSAILGAELVLLYLDWGYDLSLLEEVKAFSSRAQDFLASAVLVTALSAILLGFGTKDRRK
jgi:hypothetical protein